MSRRIISTVVNEYFFLLCKNLKPTTFSFAFRMTLQINPALDINYLNQVYGDDANIIHLIFDAFLSDSMPRWHSLEAALDEENLEESASIVHGLKPSFTMAGLTTIRPKVDQLERDIKAKVEFEVLRQAYQNISAELLPIIPILENESKRLSAI